MKQIVLVLFLHWVGDFLFQSDWMAKNKSKSNPALLLHVSCYGIPLCLVSWKFAILNMGLHGFTDWITSRVTSKLWEKKEVHWFFVVIGFDQFIHASCLILTLGVMRT